MAIDIRFMAGDAMDERNGRADKGTMETMNISLPRELAEFVARRVSGQFGNRSEYIRHLVRQDAERQRAGESDVKGRGT